MAFRKFQCRFISDKYVKMSGIWSVKQGSAMHHSSLMKGKRHCSMAGNCFGVVVNAKSGLVFSLNFSIQLTQQAGSWYVYRKENVSGNFICYECLFIMIL